MSTAHEPCNYSILGRGITMREVQVPEASEQLMELLDGLPIQTDHNPDYDDVFELAMRHDLSFYDATYLELASRLDLPLATLDTALARLADAEGVHWHP